MSPDRSYNRIIYDGFSFINIENCDELACFNSIKSNAPGSIEINVKFLRILVAIILQYLTHITNTSIMTSTFPSQWKIAQITPMPII